MYTRWVQSEQTVISQYWLELHYLWVYHKGRHLLGQVVEAGGNFIDTADAYWNGDSERVIGDWLQTQDRSKIILATKCGSNNIPGNVNTPGLSRQNIIRFERWSDQRMNRNNFNQECRGKFRKIADILHWYFVHSCLGWWNTHWGDFGDIELVGGAGKGEDRK